MKKEFRDRSKTTWHNLPAKVLNKLDISRAECQIIFEPTFNKLRLHRLLGYFLVIAFLWVIPAGAIASGPLRLSNHAINVGKVKEGVTIKKVVTLENRGKEEIVIKNVSTS